MSRKGDDSKILSSGRKQCYEVCVRVCVRREASLSVRSERRVSSLLPLTLHAPHTQPTHNKKGSRRVLPVPEGVRPAGRAAGLAAPEQRRARALEHVD